MFNNIREDFYRYRQFGGDSDSSIIAFLKVLNDEPGFKSLVIYRFGQWIVNGNESSFKLLLFPLYTLLEVLVQKLYGILEGYLSGMLNLEVAAQFISM
jgi:hypothetical protein